MQKAIHLLTSILLVLITACSTPPQPESTIIEHPNLSDLVEPIMLGNNTTVIKFTIPMYAEANFRLLDTKHYRHKFDYVANINFNDKDCINGHNAALEYKQNLNDHYARYFDNPAKWNQQNILLLKLSQNKKELTATLNNETITINTIKPIRFLHITSEPEHLKLQSVQVLNNKE